MIGKNSWAVRLAWALCAASLLLIARGLLLIFLGWSAPLPVGSVGWVLWVALTPFLLLLFPKLTDREREILDLVAAGRNNQELAEGLYLSLKTVRNYVSNIFTKLQVADREQAVVRAREAGLGRGDERP